ncbi:hypothetical protein AX15_002107 [Amanita polypyramis BW_CC]|nr:hypothetical protein AX15_002107 [Amanita polypyramis BW_CC]
MEAKQPFDASALSDVILRSSDNIDFFVIELLLCFVSPVFSARLSPDQKPHLENKNGLPILPVSSDSKTLYSLLSFIYPYVHRPKLDDCRLLLKVGMASRIYRMNVIEDKLKWPLSNTGPECGVGAYPDQFQLFSILVQLNWHKEATLAAKNTLSTSLRELPYIDELREINGADFFGYLAFRFHRVRAVSQKITVFEADNMIKNRSVTTQQKKSIKALDSHAGSELFESSNRADAILRSSDSVNFFVFKALLSLVSPAFDQMKATKVENSLPVFDLEEDSDTLRRLLLLIYPHGGKHQNNRVGSYLSLGKVIQKYKMSTVEEKLKQQLLASPLLMTNPVHVFTVSVILGWSDVAKAAAMNTLNEPLEEMPFIEEMRQLTGADLYWLVQYRFQCIDAACRVIEAEPTFAMELHKKGSDGTTVKSRVLDKLEIRPRGASVIEWRTEEFVKLDKGVYRELDLKVMIKLLGKQEVLVKSIEEAVAKVPLKVECQAENPSPKKYIG